MLEVRLIGTFAIQCDGKHVALSSRAAQSLFAYLILTAGTLHRREKLAGMFWPEETEDKARAYLRNELWRIRKVLSHSSNVEYLLVDSLTIGFDQASAYWLDIAILKNPSDKATADELVSSLSLYQGELLPGFYEDWVVLEREHLQSIYETKMSRLMELLESEKRWHEILDWAERWILLGQKPEPAYQGLMIAYDALGDHARVASTYERCVQALQELDLEPSEQTRALAFKRTSKLSVPIPLTSFIGREQELKEITDLFSQSRLVTLTGSGGVGKTRLAIQVVADLLELFPDGVWFLDLAPLNDPKLVPDTLAGVLDLQLMGGSDLSFIDLIVSYLRSRRALIIFDNCEHLIGLCAQLVHLLLTSCEPLSILATSREVLRVEGEIPYRVPSLEVPRWEREPVVDTLAKSESVRLFTERAAAISRGFVLSPQNALVIAKICKRLDGIPLAIELAAARADMLTVEKILQRLDDRFNLLTTGLRNALPRHQTLRATIEWSYELLSEQERLFFKRLAVFVGGWTLEEAEEVCSDNGIDADEILDLLSHLVDKSLVLVERSSSSENRYRRLETIRQFAYEKFAASSEAEQIRALHLMYFLRLAQKAEMEHLSEKMIKWLPKLDEEQENMRAALRWSLRGNVTAGQRMAGALSWWWEGRHVIEGYEWLQKMLAASAESETGIRAKLLAEAGWMAALLDYTEQSIALSEESLALYRQLGDKKGMAYALGTLGSRAYVRSDYDQAVTLLEESCTLSREADDRPGIGRALVALGYTAEAQGNFEQAEKFYEESLMISKEFRDQNGIGGALYFLGNLAVSQGDDTRAMVLYEEALQIEKVVENKNVTTWILNEMGMISIRSGDYEKAWPFLEEGLEVGRKTGKPADMAYSLHGLAMATHLQGDTAKARSLYIESLQLIQPLHLEHDVNLAEYMICAGHVTAAERHYEQFACMLGIAEGIAPHIQKIISQFLRMETGKFTKLARAALGEDVYTAAWETGRQMSLDDAIAYALKELQ